jgi:hypothetical protein
VSGMEAPERPHPAGTRDTLPGCGEGVTMRRASSLARKAEQIVMTHFLGVGEFLIVLLIVMVTLFRRRLRGR